MYPLAHGAIAQVTAERALKSNGIRNHSACSALATLGAPMIAILSLAGHESPQTTAKCMHLASGLQGAAVRLFDQERGTARGKAEA